MNGGPCSIQVPADYPETIRCANTDFRARHRYVGVRAHTDFNRRRTMPSLVANQIWSVLTCCHVFINARCQWFYDDFTAEGLSNLPQWDTLLIPIVTVTNLKLDVIATHHTMWIKLYLFKLLSVPMGKDSLHFLRLYN